MVLGARPLIRAADAARDRRDWPAAAALYRKAIRRGPWRAGVWLQLGHAMQHLQRLPDALAAYGWADRLRPRHADTNMHLAHVLKGLGREDEAIARYERAHAIDPSHYPARREAVRMRPRPAYAAPDRLGFVILGTTGLCNASCLHCPTGKAATAHVPRVPMAMPLFRRIIDELVELDLPIMGQLAFGLFGDGFADPFVVERVRYAREKLPWVPISVNSNGAAFDPARHGMLKDMGIIVGLHSESIVPELFDALMAPLRSERVFTKYEMLLDTFGGDVHVSIPVSRRNLRGVAESRRWFEERGAEVTLVPLMSRCSDDLSLFQDIALSPERNRCSSAALDDVAIDCDGLVLACCQDFTRRDAIGDLRQTSLRDVIYGAERQARMRAFDANEHDDFDTCRACYGDRVDAFEPALATV